MTELDTPPVYLRPAVDDAFFGRGDFELRQEEFRAVVRVRPHRRTLPAAILPVPPDDMPTQPIEIELGGIASDRWSAADDRWCLAQDLIPTWVVDIPNPVEVLPPARMEDLPTDKNRVGTFEAFRRTDPRTVAPWDIEEAAPQWGWNDLLALTGVVAAVAGMWLAAASLMM